VHTLEVRGPGVAATARRPGMVGNGGSRVFRRSLRRPRRVGPGSGQRSRRTCGLGRRATGLVFEGDWLGGGGLASPAASTRSEKICLRRCRGASVGARALRFVCRGAGTSRQGASRPTQSRERARRGWAAVDARGRCDHSGPHAARRCAQDTRVVPRRRDSRVRASAHLGRKRDAAPGSRSLRGRGVLGTCRCAPESLMCSESESSSLSLPANPRSRARTRSCTGWDWTAI